MDGKTFEDSKLKVEWAGNHFSNLDLIEIGENKKNSSRGGGPSERDICYNCGKRGHWYEDSNLSIFP